MFSLFRRNRKPLKPKLATSTFEGWVRFVRREQLNIFGLAAFDCAFPKFLAPVWTEEKKSAALQRLDPRVTHYELQKEQHRRFSGGTDLSRGSYFSICPSEIGEDGGTLLSELCAYRDAANQHIAADVGYNTQEFYTKRGLNAATAESAAKSWLCVSIHPAKRLKDQARAIVEDRVAKNTFDVDFVNRSIDRTDVFDLLNDTNVAIVAIDPLHEYRTIENVVDLRLPQTRAWFFDTFSVGEELMAVADVLNSSDTTAATFSRPFGGNISSFWQMLPELLEPNIGGSEFGQGSITQGIGAWLRANGVSALIYPSARNDSFVIFQKGKLMNFGGWNLVDYRTSTRSVGRPHHVSMAPWQTGRFFAEVQVREGEGADEGSFILSGITKANIDDFRLRAGEDWRALAAAGQQAPWVFLRGTQSLDELFRSKARTSS
jgi:hypothetical protein